MDVHTQTNAYVYVCVYMYMLLQRNNKPFIYILRHLPNGDDGKGIYPKITDATCLWLFTHLVQQFRNAHSSSI